MADKTYNLSLQLSNGSTVNAGNFTVPQGSGIQPDWNQNDNTAPDYIKNKPFGGSGDPVVLFEGEVTGGSEVLVERTMVVGNTYIAEIGSSVYTAKAKELTIDGITAYYIGNLGLGDFGENTGENYIIITAAAEGVNMLAAVALDPVDGMQLPDPFALKLYEVGEAKIPDKFLPDHVSHTHHVNAAIVSENIRLYSKAEFDAAAADVMAGSGIMFFDGLLVLNISTDGEGYRVDFAGLNNQRATLTAANEDYYFLLSTIDKGRSFALKSTTEIVNADNDKIGELLLIPSPDSAHMTLTPVGTGAKTFTFLPDDPIPSYWTSILPTHTNAVRRAMEDAGRNKSAFLFYTDAHFDYGSRVSPKLLKYLYENTQINKTIFGGDIVNTESTVDAAMAYLYEWRKAIRDLPNHHSVVGNHDDGNATNNLFDSKYIYGYLMAAEETPDIVRGGDFYYYIDCPNEKTRYLYLDTAYQTALYDAEQVQFVVDSLSDTPDGWHIVVVAHIWYTPDYNTTPTSITGLSYGGQMLLNLFDKYNDRGTGTVNVQKSSTDQTTTPVAYDFASCGGKVEFCIGGHAHIDYDGASTGGIPVILCETDSRHVRSGLGYTEGTTTEASVNAIIADYDALKVSVVRVGRGQSRTVSLPEPSAAYTNQLPISVDTDGSVYNGKGYKENVRINSSKVETAATGWDLTGLIPINKGDVVRMKNITFLDIDGTGGATSRAGIYSYLPDKTYNSVMTYSPTALPSEAWSAVYGDNGDLVQFTWPSSYNNGYMRICAKDINDSSIITVNEEIV